MKETEIVARIKEIAERLNRLFPEAYRPERTPEEQVVVATATLKCKHSYTNIAVALGTPLKLCSPY
jgi:hypothetical protein